MAGFEEPRDPGAGDRETPKLPSWAVIRKDAVPAEPATSSRDSFADLGGVPDASRSVRAEPPVSRVPEHPFDVDDPFGDQQLGGISSPWIRPPADDTEVRVVDLADEFHLTTQQALEVCAAAGAPATSGAAWLTADQADAFRAAVETYERSEPTAEEFPAWAVPPGGRRPPGSMLPGPQAMVPGAALLAPTPPPDPDEDVRSGNVMRIVLIVLAVVAIAALVAVMLTR